MRRIVSLLVVALVATSCKDGPSVVKRPGRPDVVNVEAEDPLMAAAIKKAASTLPEFKSVLVAPPAGVSSVSVKVAFPYGNNDR